LCRLYAKRKNNKNTKKINTRVMKDLLLKLKACLQAVEWAGDKTPEEVINTCHRGDWLLWLAHKLKVDDIPLTLARGHCANTVRHLMKDKRSIKAVDCAIAYGNGEISKEELKAAVAAAGYAAASGYAAAYSAAAAASAAHSAGSAAGSAVYAATAADAKKSNQLETADICRKYLGKLILELC
jgi:hypothetical protein